MDEVGIRTVSGGQTQCVGLEVFKEVRCGDNQNQIAFASEVQAKTATTQMSERTTKIEVRFPKFLGGGKPSLVKSKSENQKIIRENYVNFFNGVSYLVEKYGINSASHLLNKLYECSGNQPLSFYRDEYGRQMLSRQIPDGTMERQFTAKDLHAIERKIIERNEAPQCTEEMVLFPKLPGGGEIPYDVALYTLKDYRSSVGSRMSYDRLELDPNLDEHGRERLKPLSPDDQRKSRFPFTADDVHKFESMIIENSRSCSMLEIISAVGGIILDLSQFVMSADAECALHLAEKATMEM